MLANSFVHASATSAVMTSVKASPRTSRMTPLRICTGHKTTQLFERFLDSHFLESSVQRGFELASDSAVNRIPDGHDHKAISKHEAKTQHCWYKCCHLLVLPNYGCCPTMTFLALICWFTHPTSFRYLVCQLRVPENIFVFLAITLSLASSKLFSLLCNRFVAVCWMSE